MNLTPLFMVSLLSKIAAKLHVWKMQRLTERFSFRFIYTGRPFPLKGRFMANVFIHFEPIGLMGGELEYGKTDLPPYVIPESPEEEHWRTHNPDGHKVS